MFFSQDAEQVPLAGADAVGGGRLGRPRYGPRHQLLALRGRGIRAVGGGRVGWGGVEVGVGRWGGGGEGRAGVVKCILLVALSVFLFLFFSIVCVSCCADLKPKEHWLCGILSLVSMFLFSTWIHNY